MTKSLLKKLIEEKETLDQKTQELQQQIDDCRRESKFDCVICGGKHKIKYSTLYESECYDPNTGSPNGGFYKHDTYYVSCINNLYCFNRICFRNVGNYDERLKRKNNLETLFWRTYYKSFFNEKIYPFNPTYSSYIPGNQFPSNYKCVDNYWFDDNREKIYEYKLLKKMGI